jgi:hypothetical protein
MQPKKWTVLIYANGNNDLEPEIACSLLAMEQVGCGTNINVIVQLARAPCWLVQTLRPQLKVATNIDGDWNGVRRYRLNQKPFTHHAGERAFGSHLAADLGNINMSNPSTLQDFICWGVKSYPAQHYLLILVGHGAGMVGMMSEYTTRCPQIMSIPGIKSALDQAATITGSKLDILLFDSCYMNNLEIMYELSSDKGAPRYIIAPEKTPMAGLNYHHIILILRENAHCPPRVLSKQLVVALTAGTRGQSPLAAIKVNWLLLALLKILIGYLALLIIKYNINLHQWFTSAYYSYPYLPLNELTTYLATKASGWRLKLILWLIKKITQWLQAWRNANILTIYLPNNRDYITMHHYYCGLRFTASNPWLKLLSSTREKAEATQQLPGVLLLPIEGVIHVIKSQTPSLTTPQIWAIINQMGWQYCPKLNNNR